MTTRSWTAVVMYVASIALIFVGPFDWWVNLLSVGAFWAATFPRRNARRQNYTTLRSYLATSDAAELIMLVPTMVGLAILWLVTVPLMWVLVQGGVFGERPEKDTIAS